MFGLLLPVQQLFLEVEILAVLKNVSKDCLETSIFDHVSSWSENFVSSQPGQEALAVIRSLSDPSSVITLSLPCTGFVVCLVGFF